MRAASIPARAPAVPLRSRRLLALAGDGRLVEQVRRGNDAAFEVVFERHGPAILAFCRHMLGSPEEAEDAVQHTFAAAYRDLQRGQREVALKAWLFAIARNRCLSLLRARREVPAGVEALESRASSGAELAEQVEERADLRRLLADVRELPDEQRAALLLTELGDLSHAEVAGVLDCEVSRVKGLVFRARSALIARREAREAPCQVIREQLANLRGGALRRAELRLHLRDCPGCRAYREQVRQQRRMLAAALPVAPTLGLKSSVLAAIGLGGGSAGGLTTAAGTLGGATLAKVAVAGVLAGGGMVAGDAIVDSNRPAVAPSAPAQAPDRGGGDAARRSTHVGGGLAGADRTKSGTERGHDGTALARGRGPVDAPPKSTPVRRGPAAKQAKPWKTEAGTRTGPPGHANGKAKPEPGRRIGAKQGPRANGRSKPAGKPNGGPKANAKPPPSAKANAQAPPSAKSNGGPKANAKPPPGANPNGSAKPLTRPRAKADSKPEVGGKTKLDGKPGGQAP